MEEKLITTWLTRGLNDVSKVVSQLIKIKIKQKDILCELLLNLINIPAVVIKVHLPGGYRGFIFLFLIFVFSRVSHLARHSFSINWWFMMNACGLEKSHGEDLLVVDHLAMKQETFDEEQKPIL